MLKKNMSYMSKENIIKELIHSYLIPKYPLYRIKYFFVESQFKWNDDDFGDEGAILKLKHKNIIVEAVQGNVYTKEEYNNLKKDNPNFKLKINDVQEQNNFLYIRYALKKSIVKESFIEKWESLPDRTIRAGEAAFVLMDVERLV